jgi:hypothetical protein
MEGTPPVFLQRARKLLISRNLLSALVQHSATRVRKLLKTLESGFAGACRRVRPSVLGAYRFGNLVRVTLLWRPMLRCGRLLP